MDIVFKSCLFCTHYEEQGIDVGQDEVELVPTCILNPIYYETERDSYCGQWKINPEFDRRKS